MSGYLTIAIFLSEYSGPALVPQLPVRVVVVPRRFNATLKVVSLRSSISQVVLPHLIPLTLHSTRHLRHFGLGV